MNRVQTFLIGLWLGSLVLAGAYAIDDVVNKIVPFTEITTIIDLRKQLLHKSFEQQVTNQAIQDLNYQVDSLKSIINRTHIVTATVYYPTGDEMRSGKCIPCNYHQGNARTKYIAISQDLWNVNGGPYSFGDSIRVVGTSYDGVYVIEDTMNKRFKNRVDILVSGKVNEIWFGVKIYKI